MAALSTLCGLAADVHGVVDVGHGFSFYADGRFAGQYLSDQKMTTSWGNLYDFPTDNLNLIVLLDCDHNLKYTEKDIAYIDKFLNDGGTVLIMGGPGESPQNNLAKHYGAPFIAAGVAPLAGKVDINKDKEIEGGAGAVMELAKPDAWTILVGDKDGKPVMARTKKGKGTLVVGSRSLAGNRPDAKDNINAAWLGPILKETAVAKKVSDEKPFEGRWLTAQGNKKKVGTLMYHYSDYLEPYLEAMIDIDTRIRPLIEKRMGVPLSDGMAGEVGLLATGGGGFSSGSCVGLAVFWGGFPEKEDSMIEFLTHESVHSWVLPYPEVANEPIATYVGNLVMLDTDHAEEGQRRINGTIEGAKKIDPEMKLYNPWGENKAGVPEIDGGQQNAIHWGKSYWIWEEMRKKDPNFNAKYFQAKRKYVKDVPRYTADDTVAVISYVLGEDMFPWFNDHGITVDKSKSQISFEDTKDKSKSDSKKKKAKK